LQVERCYTVEGPARIGRLTKALVHRLRPGDIAVIAHTDLDELAAQDLASCGVAAVLDTRDSATGRLPVRGPRVLLDAGVPLVDRLDPELLELLDDGDAVTVRGGEVLRGDRVLATGRQVTPEVARACAQAAELELACALREFGANTLRHAAAELELLVEPIDVPDVDVCLKGRPCVVLARGPGYREDFSWVARRLSLRREAALIAVDGAADWALACGWRPDLLVGDMDSASVAALRCGARLVVHASVGGDAPGARRLDALGLRGVMLRCRGTSVDAALLLAAELGASPIVALGIPRGALDYLERGRAGVASSWLVRLRLGDRIIDATGLARLALWMQVD